ncbi:MAG: cytochrome c oxidase subunit II [Gammaproteobacteria bacterium]|nr:cytochrome c oxidase subunit II [Gammaproteobacteria bacterium]
MHIDQTEKKWIWISVLMTFVMMGVLTLYAVGSNIHPPSGFEPIDSTRLHLSEEFSEDNLGLKKNDDGTLTLTMVAARYGFYPSKVEVPVNTPVKIRIASADVLHGVHVPYTNFATMVVPGYISEVNTTFMKTGDFTLLCNEYCGLGHDHMWSRLKVVPKSSS